MARRARHWFAGIACAAVLLAVFSWYLRPDFMLTLADQLWACF